MTLIRRQRQKGFSMIELLISIVIMSVGVLGMAGLQMISMQNNRSALLQGEAMLKANDILDRIRANPSGTYDVAVTDTPAMTTDCRGSTCSEANMAAFDIAQWQCSINSTAADDTVHPVCDTDQFDIQGTMPGGQCVNLTDPCAGGSISLSGDVYTVTVQWVDQQQVSATTGNVRSVSVSMRAP